MTLEKTSAGLGFSLEGGKGSLHGDKPLTVNRIFKGEVCVPSCRHSPPVGEGGGKPSEASGHLQGRVGFLCPLRGRPAS